MANRMANWCLSAHAFSDNYGENVEANVMIIGFLNREILWLSLVREASQSDNLSIVLIDQGRWIEELRLVLG